MNQTQMGTSYGFPKFKNVFAVSKKKNDAKSSRLSSAVVMFGSMLMLALQLLAGKANAVNIPVTSFTCTQATTATTTCVGNGFFANGWFSPGTGYWQYNLNTSGYTGITMSFTNTKSSAAGPTTGQVYYNIGAGDVAVGSPFTVTTSCTPQSFTLPAACEGVTNLIIRVKMTGATANTATHRISAVNVFDGASSTCSGTPAAGVVAAASNPVCAGSSTLLTLTGAAAGSGITYQWQQSPNNSTWTNISGATSLSYNATPSAATYYRVVTTCAVGGSSNSPSLLVNVTTVSVAPITGLTSSQLTVGDVVALSDATTGGVWSSSNTSAVTIDATGHLSANFGGSSVISYKVTTGGCSGTSTANVTVIWPNTLALYAGVNGNSTAVINVPNDVVSTLSAVGFGTNTPCTSGGYSGITVNLADSVLNADSAHISYKVYPTSGHALNVYRIHARARVSTTGPKKARIGYRFWSQGFASGWVFENADVTLVSGTCGNSANSWDFNTGNSSNPNPTINGIKDSIEVAVYPFAPDTTTGTFQLNSLEVYGTVSSDSNCNVVLSTADSVLPSIVNLCDSGSYFLNYNIGSGGIAGPGIEYQWQVSTTGLDADYTDIDEANGVVYQTPEINLSSPSDTFYYRVAVTCDFSGLTAYSEPSIVTIHATPANAGTISGGLASTVLPAGHMLIGAPTYTLSSTVAGGTWSSNDTSTISINPTSGVATPNIQGDAVITYRTLVNGCFGISKATYYAYHNGTKALYVGTGGNSLNVYAVAGTTGTTATNFTLTNWDSTQACQSGGRAGLVNTTTVQDPSTNGSVVTRVAAAASGAFTASNIIATLRDPATGTYLAYLGYKAVGASTWTTSAPVSVDFDDCGYSHNEITFPVSVAVGTSGVDFAVFGYNGSTTTGLQVNTLSVIGNGAALMKGAGVANMDIANNIQLYPNPAENTLNVNAPQAVNVVIMSIDGKKLLEQKNAISVNVSSLMSGMYLIQVYDESNKTLLKTEKFIKK